MTERAGPQAPVITIDGPSGSGKGTLAGLLAERLGWHLLDSGALYRIVALAALESRADLDDGEALARLAAGLAIRFGDGAILLGGRDVSETIRGEAVSAASSRVAALTPVRRAILDLQRAQRRPPGLVADGRDMGTVVFPDAELKIFLDASAEVRAERRYNQLKNKGLTVNFAGLLANLKERDERDRNRAASPLVPASDALLLDSTDLDIDDVLGRVYAEARNRRLTGA